MSKNKKCSITKNDLENAYKQGYAECEKTIAEMEKRAFLAGIEASKTIEWTNESNEILRVLKEYGYDK